MQPDKAGALGRKCVPGLKERAPCCTAADLPGPDETAPRHRRSAQIENQGSRGNGPGNASPPSVHIPGTTHGFQPDQGSRNKRNRDDQPDQSSRWCGPAVGRRPHSAVTEPAWFEHPAAEPLPEGRVGAGAWPTTRPRRSVMANRPPAAPTPTIRTYFTWPTGGKRFPGGSLQGANSENSPILVGQKGAVYLARLAVGGIRELHPLASSAWEVNVILAGRSHGCSSDPTAPRMSSKPAKATSSLRRRATIITSKCQRH